MALIRCPECAHQVSNKAERCVSCGYPLKDYVETINRICKVDGILMDLSYILKAKTEVEKKEAVFSFKKQTGCTLKQAKSVLEYIDMNGELPAEFVIKNAKNKEMSFGLGIDIVQREYIRADPEMR